MKPNPFDETDQQILTMLITDSRISQCEMARRIGISQPSVGNHMKKLAALGKYETQFGVDFTQLDTLYFIKVELKTTQPDKIMAHVDNCPLIVNAMVTAGPYNLLLFLVHNNVRQFDQILERLFGADSGVTARKWEIVPKVAKKWLINLNHIKLDPADPFAVCKQCQGCKLGMDAVEKVAQPVELPSPAVMQASHELAM